MSGDVVPFIEISKGRTLKQLSKEVDRRPHSCSSVLTSVFVPTTVSDHRDYMGSDEDVVETCQFSCDWSKMSE